MKTALLSVANKTNLVPFAQFLQNQNYLILSTGGTYNFLKENKIAVQEVKERTNFPEILNGRVKTLHPNIHAGILAKRNQKNHMETLQEMGIASIDLVVVNLYPFFENAEKNLTDEDLVEFIDIGGPTMLRAAAKSFFDVTVVTNTEDYKMVQEQIQAKGNTTLELRKLLAAKVFNLTSAYDAAIAQTLSNESFPKYYNAAYQKQADLRYGENPHQKAAFYTEIVRTGAMKNFVQYQGKALSFNNIRDMDLAWKVVNEFQETCCCAVKHSTPCGVAIDNNIEDAYQKAHNCDPISIFGGIVGFNKTVTKELALLLNQIFLEIVVAPGFEPDALEVFNQKKNLRVIQINQPLANKLQVVQVDGGLLVQETDMYFSKNIQTVSQTKATEQEYKDLIFAQKVIKHVKSNAIIVAKNQMALGVGTGETNRIWAAQQAIERAKSKEKDGLVMASDAFFPFRDVVDFAAKSGIKAIIQPGGSIRDKDSIQAANEHKMAMLTTGVRHFLH